MNNHPHCPSPSAAGRIDRCGVFSFPVRCPSVLKCSMPDAQPLAPRKFTICAGDNCYVLKARSEQPGLDPKTRAEMLAELERREKARGMTIPAPTITAAGFGRTTYVLSDGSVCRVVTEPHHSHLFSMIDHLVDDTVVWSQGFSATPEEHPAQVVRVVAKMHVRPDAYFSPYWRERGHV